MEIHCGLPNFILMQKQAFGNFLKGFSSGVRRKDFMVFFPCQIWRVLGLCRGKMQLCHHSVLYILLLWLLTNDEHTTCAN